MKTNKINILFTFANGLHTATARIGTEYAGFATCRSKKQAEQEARAMAQRSIDAFENAPSVLPSGRQGGPARVGSFGMCCHISELTSAATTAGAAALNGAPYPLQRFDEVSTLAVAG